jgi:hypothetical protein
MRLMAYDPVSNSWSRAYPNLEIVGDFMGAVFFQGNFEVAVGIYSQTLVASYNVCTP